MQGGTQLHPSAVGDPYGVDTHPAVWRPAPPEPDPPRPRHGRHGKGPKPLGWLHQRHEPRRH